MLDRAAEVIARCRTLALCSEEEGFITRTFLSPPMREVHAHVSGWMREAGLHVSTDAAGNLRGTRGDGSRVMIGSHLDTVRRAGAFDGILGVVMGVELARLTDVPIEVVGFSEEEGVRFGTPFLGSRALVGTLDEPLLGLRDAEGVSVADAIRAFGLTPEEIPQARIGGNVAAYLEFHIEQGPVLESLDLALGVVDAIVGQTRMEVVFQGAANHAGTTPMHLRRDALAAAAEWILAVERSAVAGTFVATVGRASVRPGAGNVIAGEAIVSLDLRHSEDRVRLGAVEALLKCAQQIADRRGIAVTSKPLLDQAAVAMDRKIAAKLARAVQACGHALHRMPSGAGHDAMILAPHVPTGMLFLRSPGGISHHPDEAVLAPDVAAALEVGVRFLKEAAHA
jgi:allantoate deiminase